MAFRHPLVYELSQQIEHQLTLHMVLRYPLVYELPHNKLNNKSHCTWFLDIP